MKIFSVLYCFLVLLATQTDVIKGYAPFPYVHPYITSPYLYPMGTVPVGAVPVGKSSPWAKYFPPAVSPPPYAGPAANTSPKSVPSRPKPYLPKSFPSYFNYTPDIIWCNFGVDKINKLLFANYLTLFKVLFDSFVLAPVRLISGIPMCRK